MTSFGGKINFTALVVNILSLTGEKMSSPDHSLCETDQLSLYFTTAINHEYSKSPLLLQFYTAILH